MKDQSLHDLTKIFLNFQGQHIRENCKLETNSNGIFNFDFVIFKENNPYCGVWVKDWERSLGVNVVIRFIRTIENSELKDGIIVTNTVSSHARNMAEKCNVKIITRGIILENLRGRGEFLG